MIDLTSEQLISFAEAAKLIPGRGGKQIDPATIWRWSKLGVRARSGERIKLESFRCGGRSATSREAVQRFIAALNQPAEGPAVPVRTPGQRQLSSDRAAKKLTAAGI
jgi:hypothetical protein